MTNKPNKFTKIVASLMEEVKEKDIRIKDANYQLTLDGNEEIEIEGMIYLKKPKSRIQFKIVSQVLD